ncbi:MAG: hemerythrin domain-containing protein [Syntrophobacteraceae bacterium]
MNATDQLRAEHDGILTILEVLEKIALEMTSGAAPNVNHLEKILEFLSVFADQCHHGKEEDILFPALELKGIPREGGPIGVMLREHDHGREHIRAMREALEKMKMGQDATEPFVQAATDYTHLLRSHILKENNALFVMAEKKLSDEEQARLCEAFETMEREKIGVGRHEAFHQLMDELAGVYL